MTVHGDMTVPDRRYPELQQLHRYALVACNSDRQDANGSPRSGIADAKSMQQELESRGFQVPPWGTCVDLTGPQLLQKLSNFADNFQSRQQRRSQEPGTGCNISEVLCLASNLLTLADPVHYHRRIAKCWEDTLVVLLCRANACGFLALQLIVLSGVFPLPSFSVVNRSRSRCTDSLPYLCRVILVEQAALPVSLSRKIRKHEYKTRVPRFFMIVFWGFPLIPPIRV